MLRFRLKQSGFAPLFILIPLIVVITITATLGVPRILNNRNQTANISEQIEQKEKELEELRAASISQNQDALAQELLALKKELDAIKNTSQNKPSTTKQTTPKPTSTPTPTPEESLRIILSASRYSLPANGEAVSFITAEIKDRNGRVVESFSGSIEFQTTAGVLVPVTVNAKNGTAYTELRSSTVPINLNVIAQSGSIKSNSINLSFSVPSTPIPITEFNIDDNDVRAVVALKCPPGNDVWGSGVIFSSDGKILTNYHVEDDAGTCDVFIADDSRTSAKFKYKAYTMAKSDSPDIAILKIYVDQNSKPVTDVSFNYIEIGDSTILKIGDPIMVLGYPDFGSASNTVTLTRGVVSGTTTEYIKTDTKISGGNSGGPVIDKNKRLVGIATGTFSGDREELLGAFIGTEKISQWAKSKNIYWPY